MILADKIMDLRKKSGMSQEELAGLMNVSRQSVSKWESAQAVPDLNKIIMLSQIFGVSTDFLLKDEIGIEENEFPPEDAAPSDYEVRQVSMEEAREYLDLNERFAGKIAIGVFMCVISPIVLILLAALSKDTRIGLSENVAAGIGLIVLILLVACAVAIFLITGLKLNKYEFLEKDMIETVYGVSGMVRERKDRYSDTYTRELVIGIVLCVLAVVPLFGSIMIAEDGLTVIIGVDLLLLFIATGVFFIVKSSTLWGGYQKLLEEGDYTREKKRENKKLGSVMGIYWMLIVAAYLAYSFVTNDWGRSWIIWPVAGVLCAPVREIAKLIRK